MGEMTIAVGRLLPKVQELAAMPTIQSVVQQDLFFIYIRLDYEEIKTPYPYIDYNFLLHYFTPSKSNQTETLEMQCLCPFHEDDKLI